MQVLGILDQISLATRPVNRIAFLIGSILGAFVPLATYTVAHYEVADSNLKWALVAGGLIYSAITVVQWGRIAFGMWAKSIGFVLLVEGTAVFSSTLALSIAAVTILASINAISTGYRLVADRRETRKEHGTFRQSRPKSKTSKAKPRAVRGAGQRTAVPRRRSQTAAVPALAGAGA
jgi:hypothetical protein